MKKPGPVRGEASGVYVKLPLPEDLLTAVSELSEAASSVSDLLTALRTNGASLVEVVERGLRSAERAAHSARRLASKKKKRKAPRK
jgi:hypothetical protein